MQTYKDFKTNLAQYKKERQIAHQKFQGLVTNVAKPKTSGFNIYSKKTQLNENSTEVVQAWNKLSKAKQHLYINRAKFLSSKRGLKNKILRKRWKRLQKKTRNNYIQQAREENKKVELKYNPNTIKYTYNVDIMNKIYRLEWAGTAKGGKSIIKGILTETPFPPITSQKPISKEFLLKYVYLFLDELSEYHGYPYGIKYNNDYYSTDIPYPLIQYSMLQIKAAKVSGKIRIENVALRYEEWYDSVSNVQYANQKLCGIDSLHYFLANSAKVGLKSLTHDQIAKQMLEIKGYDINGLTAPECKEELKLEGITLNDYKNWITKYGKGKMNLYIIDAFNKQIDTLHFDGADRSLIIKVRNEHIYVIDNITYQKQIIETGRIPNKRLMNMDDIDMSKITVIRQLKTLFDDIKASDNNIIIVVGMWKDVISAYMQQSKACINKFDYANGINSFECEITGKIIMIKPFYDTEFNYIEQLKKYKNKDIVLPEELLKFKGLSAARLHAELMKVFIGQIPKSFYDNKCIEYIESFNRPTLYESYEKDQGMKGVGIDIKKADSYARCNLLDNIPVFDVHDKIEKFDGVIKVGLYHLKEFYLFKNRNNKCIYIPDGWYTSGFVNKCLENHIIKKDQITEQYISKTSIQKDLFNKITTFLFDAFIEADAKFISNAGTGSFGQKYEKSFEAAFETSFDLAKTYINKGYAVMNVGKSYIIHKKFVNRLIKDTLPVYLSIIDSSIWHVYETMKQYTKDDSIIYSLHRDCFYGRNLKEVPTKDSFKNMKLIDTIGKAYQCEFVELVKPIFYQKPKYKSFSEVASVKWNKMEENRNMEIIMNDGMTITGCGGSGKSTLIKQMTEQLINGLDECMIKKDTPYLVMAGTNKAVDALRSKGIDACTIHVGLTKECEKTGRRVLKYKESFPYKVLIIDEAFNMSSKCVRWIYEVYLRFNKTNNLKIYFLGDPNQCLPVEKEENDEEFGVINNYMESMAFMQMTNFTHMHLNYIEGAARYDKKLYEESMKIIKGQVPNFQIVDEKIKLKRFICKRNKTVDEINKFMMKDRVNRFTIPLMKRGSESKLTEMAFNAGDPVTPYNAGEGFYNNQDFLFVTCDDDNVTLHPKYGKDNLVIAKSKFIKSFIPAFAITVNRSQGSTFDFQYAILDIDAMYTNDLYVAVTRATSWQNVFLDQEAKTLKKFKYQDTQKELTLWNRYKTGYIYKLLHPDIEKFYIGSTDDVERRFQEHKDSKAEDLLHTEMRKMDGWKIEVVEKVLFLNKRELHNLEKKYIQMYDSSKLLNTLLVKPTKTKPVIIKHEVKLKGISFDEKKNRYCVKKTGLLRKQFYVSNYESKEAAFEAAKEYLSQ